ncbi:MAG TPA: TRAP transporter small permease subunit [Geminicoccaceae bacterium]|nr:TRAP transporter small permease subunit [Geminicoccus sp.]HMU53052.1 TRAP transporter small permease subunit [Geminicoccaceae bacterium]
MSPLARATGLIVAATRLAMSAAFAVMILATLVQVVNRYALGFTIFWTEELVVLLLVWSMLLGLPVQLWQHEEIVVDVLPLGEGTPERVKRVAAAVASVVFCAVLAWSGWAFARRGLPVHSPALGLSRFWFFVPIPFSAALSVLVLLVRKPAPASAGFE